MQSDVPSHLKCSAPSTAAAHDPRAAALASGKPSRMPVSCRIGWNSEFVFGSSSSLLNMHLVQGCSVSATPGNTRARPLQNRIKAKRAAALRAADCEGDCGARDEPHSAQSSSGHPHTHAPRPRPPRAMRARIVWEGRLINKTVLLKSDSLLTRSLTGGSSYVDNACRTATNPISVSAEPRSPARGRWSEGESSVRDAAVPWRSIT